jgi:hypothetical protein
VSPTSVESATTVPTDVLPETISRTVSAAAPATAVAANAAFAG